MSRRRGGRRLSLTPWMLDRRWGYCRTRLTPHFWRLDRGVTATCDTHLPATGDFFFYELDSFTARPDLIPYELPDELLPRSVSLFEHDFIHFLQKFIWKLNQHLNSFYQGMHHHSRSTIFSDPHTRQVRLQ